VAAHVQSPKLKTVGEKLEFFVLGMGCTFHSANVYKLSVRPHSSRALALNIATDER
jgi:hypothetical protein